MPPNCESNQPAWRPYFQTQTSGIWRMNGRAWSLKSKHRLTRSYQVCAYRYSYAYVARTQSHENTHACMPACLHCGRHSDAYLLQISCSPTALNYTLPPVSTRNALVSHQLPWTAVLFKLTVTVTVTEIEKIASLSFNSFLY